MSKKRVLTSALTLEWEIELSWKKHLTMKIGLNITYEFSEFAFMIPLENFLKHNIFGTPTLGTI